MPVQPGEAQGGPCDETTADSEEAAKKRVARALQRLRRIVSRKGVTLPVAAIALGLSTIPAMAAPTTTCEKLNVLLAGCFVSRALSASLITRGDE